VPASSPLSALDLLERVNLEIAFGQNALEFAFSDSSARRRLTSTGSKVPK
jgi:hypothetical protein